jgi:hypothetical protein
MSDRCPTTSGPHRCERPAGHAPPCETSAPEYATRQRTTEERIAILEAQVQSLQMSAPKGIDHG